MAAPPRHAWIPPPSPSSLGAAVAISPPIVCAREYKKINKVKICKGLCVHCWLKKVEKKKNKKKIEKCIEDNRIQLPSWWARHVTRRTLFLLFLGQVVSFVLALTSFSSSLIASLGVDAPITQMVFTYLGLALVYGSILLSRRQKLMLPWYWYLILGFVDVQGNYLVNKAYQYSSLTSVTLLDCWTIPWAIILTYIFIGSRYSLLQLFGAVVCIVGLALVLLSDAGVGGGGGSKPLLGDTLVIAGTIFFAMSNVGEEFCVKKKDRVEVLTMIGVFGLLVSLVQLSIIELKTLESVTWSTDIILAFVGYTVSCFMFYTVTPFVLKLGGAAIFNLSLLTSDMWAVIFRIFLYRQQVDWLYYLAFATVVIGLIIYTMTEKDPVPVASLEDGNHNAEYEVLRDTSADCRD